MNRRIIGLVASGALAMGAFLPIVSVPFLGSLNYFMNGRGDGVFIIVFAAVSALLFAFNQFRFAIVPAIASLAFELFTLVQLNSSVSSELSVFVRIEWGWIVLFASSITLIVLSVGALRDESAQASSPDKSIRRHSGQAKKIARDLVDSRFSLSEIAGVGLIATLFLSTGLVQFLFLALVPPLRGNMPDFWLDTPLFTIFTWLLLIAIASDAYLINRGLTRVFREANLEKPAGIHSYALRRALLPKRVRKHRGTDVL